MEFDNINYSKKLLEELTNLRKFGNELIELTSILNFINLQKITLNKNFSEKESIINNAFLDVLNVVIQKTFHLININLNPQVISVFLMSKNGYLKRYKIDIYSHTKNLNSDSISFPPDDEHYNKGESFSGKSAEGNPYGEPYLSNSLDVQKDKLTYGKVYEQGLGFLKCGITVPLDSSHRTFGTLEVINKIDPIKKIPDRNLLYSEIEVFWLTVVGGHLARTISRIKKKQEEYVANEITRLLVSNDYENDSDEVCHIIVNQLITDLTPFKACILRFLEGEYLMVTKTASTNDIDMSPKKNPVRKIGEGMVGKVCETQQYIVRHVDEHPELFKSRDWITSQRLHSFVCVPLVVNNKSVGTLSLFTGYKYYFNDSDLDFLINISNLLAAYKVGLNRKMIEQKRKEEDNGKEKNDADEDTLEKYLKRQLLIFEKKLPDLRKEHLGKYVRFHEGEVLDSDQDEIALLERIYSDGKNIPEEVFVEQVTDENLPEEIWDYFPLE